MRLRIGLAALATAFGLGASAIGTKASRAQDFSITNQVEPADARRRDLMRQLQAWWDVHGYYPRHASNSDEGGTVKLHLVILPDGRIWAADVLESSGSLSLDTAGASVFRGGFVRPSPDGTAEAALDISLHYVLARRHDQPVAAGHAPAPSRRPFTIENDPVKSPILETMLQRTCTGTVVRQGIRNHPWYGVRSWAEAVFFRKPDGTPWIKFYEGGFPILAPVSEVGKMVQWTGRAEHLKGGTSRYTQYTVWPEGENNLNGSLTVIYDADARLDHDLNLGGTVDFACATETVPAIGWSAWSVTPGVNPPGDPP